ncbi:MAG: 2,3-bisphosphoglycerate-dependent phosphoglycerate mutase [Actinomycetota bacterium]|nr:2,3-bisphosphoglycerate-dependent phosphoglycerate mutase [Actinomycetota bacterium]
MSKSFRQLKYLRPAGATELLLVRHGESAPAVEGTSFPLVDGQGDPPLSPDGREQAARVATRLMVSSVDAAYATSLQRTVETAAPFVERSGLPLAIEPELREVFLGEWEGGAFRQRVIERDPVAVRMLEEQRWDVIPGAEPAAEFGARVRAGVLRVASLHPDQRVAVFTHGGVIGCVLALATGCQPFAFTNADNGSITHVVVSGAGPSAPWTVRRFNDTAHLEPGFTVLSAPLT